MVPSLHMRRRVSFRACWNVGTQNVKNCRPRRKQPRTKKKKHSGTSDNWSRKLKAQWTPEFAQDLNAYQSLDAEAELTSIMSEYIALEIDLENLDMLIQDASAWDEYWNVQNNQQLNSTQTGYTNLNFYNTQGQWFQTLGTKMQKVSNKIHLI